MSFSPCRNFVQSTTQEPAAKHGIDDRNTEGKGCGSGLNPGHPLQG